MENGALGMEQDDIFAALAAAEAAANAGDVPEHQSSPVVKHETPPASTDVTQPQPPPPKSPLKRSRSVDATPDERAEKKSKGSEFHIDDAELQRMINGAGDLADAGALGDAENAPGPEETQTHGFGNGLMDSLDNLFGTVQPQDQTIPSIEPGAFQPSPSRARSKLWSNPVGYLPRTLALPALGHAAVEILRALCDKDTEDTISFLNEDGEEENDIMKAYRTLRSWFYVIRRYFSNASPLLYPDQLDLSGTENREIIRIANLATMSASLFGAHELGWPELDANFLNVFVEKDRDMSYDVSEFWLKLKIQMFLTSLDETGPETAVEELLDNIFVTDLENVLQRHHPSLPLTPIETKFLEKAKQQRTKLLEGSKDDESRKTLAEKNTYISFLDTLNAFLDTSMDVIDNIVTNQVAIASTVDDAQSKFDTNGLDNFDFDAIINESAQRARGTPTDNVPTNNDDLAALLGESVPAVAQHNGETSGTTGFSSDSSYDHISEVTRRALETIHQTKYEPTGAPQPNPQSAPAQTHTLYQSHQQNLQPQPQYQQYQQPPANMQPPFQAGAAMNANLPPNQTASTSALYEKARQKHAQRSTVQTRQAGNQSTRRPWSQAEEKALMQGLDLVKGPHWSQILQLFGQNGSISNVLADRTQVQLKDKARNLKLFFLKANSEMPYYFQAVTGELKTRAPSQAAKREAERQARQNSQEQQQHVEGINILANGLQDHAAQRPSSMMPRSATPGRPMSRQGSNSGASLTPQRPPAHAAVPVVPAAQPVQLPSFSRSQQNIQTNNHQTHMHIHNHPQSPAQVHLSQTPSQQPHYAPHYQQQGQQVPQQPQQEHQTHQTQHPQHPQQQHPQDHYQQQPAPTAQMHTDEVELGDLEVKQEVHTDSHQHCAEEEALMTLLKDSLDKGTIGPAQAAES